MNFLVVEYLTQRFLARHASLINDQDSCWALRVKNGDVARVALESGKWDSWTWPKFDEVISRYSGWVYRIATTQTLGGSVLPLKAQALLGYGLDVRLKNSALAKAFVECGALEREGMLETVDLQLIADDPYLRNTFLHGGGIRSRLRTLQLHGSSGLRPLLRALRERLAANARVRQATVQRAAFRRYMAAAGVRRSAGKGRQKVAAAFILNQRYLNLFEPVRTELEARGWRVPVFYYNPVAGSVKDATLFSEAVKGIVQNEVGNLHLPKWQVSEELRRGCPTSIRWLNVALSASWLTGLVQTHHHQRLVEAWQPDVVVSYGPDIMSLALQAATESLGISSLFIPHDVRGPSFSSWFFGATASALAGHPCIEANAIGPHGLRNEGLVPTGLPQFDALLVRAEQNRGRRRQLSGLSVLEKRPYLAVAFAEWGHELLVHALQRKMLRMLAVALPDDVFLVVKVHPQFDEQEVCKRVLAASLPAQAFAVVRDQQYSTPDLLEACHVAVAGERSMVLMDALVMNRPGIGIRFPEHPMGSGDMNHPAKDFRNNCWLVDDVVQLRRALIDLTRDASSQDALLAQRKRYIERFLLASDGRASQRVADLVEHLAAGKSPESFIPMSRQSLLEE